MKFNPRAKLDPSQVLDLRNPVNAGTWEGGTTARIAGARMGRSAAAYRYAYGAKGSPAGGTPAKDKSSAPAVPKAPSVASRTKPGTVPRRTRGRQ